MGRRAALATVGTGTVAASAATAASSLDSHADDYFGEEDESEDEDTTEDEVSSATTTVQEGSTEAQGAQASSEPQVAAQPPDWLNTNGSNGNKSTYFGKGMAFENATFKQGSPQQNLSGGGDNYFGDFVNTYQKGDYAKIKSNLKVTVTKHTCNQNKWGGEMTWFWSFENQKTKKGFITFNSAKTDPKKNGLVLTGIFYILEKTGNEWEVKKKKEVKDTDNKTITKANFRTHFPKPYWYTKKGGFDRLYKSNWDFIPDENKLNLLCDSTTNSTTKSGEWRWETSYWWEKHWGWWG